MEEEHGKEGGREGGRTHWLVDGSETETAGIGTHQTIELNSSKWNNVEIPKNTHTHQERHREYYE